MEKIRKIKKKNSQMSIVNFRDVQTNIHIYVREHFVLNYPM